ncbi:hypothetical protein BH09DEP1_BH09DEP1_1760 [soil metagenome]
MVKNIFLIGVLVGSSLNGMQQGNKIEIVSQNNQQNKSPILTAAEVTHIKHDMYRIYVHEMGILRLDFDEMAHGNADLANDLKILYYESRNYDRAKTTLRTLCTKWKIEKPAESDDEKDDE